MTTFVDISQDINALKPGIIALRRELHQHPELAFEEVWTAATLAGRRRVLGLTVQEGIGGTGVLAVLEGAKPGQTLLIRSDMDALAMAETTGRAYASQLENRNHSCGHDAHAAVVAGVAEVLVRHRDRIAGRLAFVFQPTDEPSQAAIEVHMGRGEPSQAAIEVNLALYDNALRARLLDRIEEVAGAIDSAAGGTLSAEVDDALPALVNDDQVTGALAQAAQRVIGRANILKHWRHRFSDDFGLFMATAPGCLMLLGTANPDKGITEIWHRPSFDIDEDALPMGVQIMSLAALDLLQ